MKTSTLLAILGTALAAACGGVKLGDHTLVAPVARPTVPTADSASDSAAASLGVSSGGGDQGRGASAPDHVELPAEVVAARKATGCFVGGRAPKHNAFAPSNAPVDPWKAVDGDRPRVLPHVHGPQVERGDARCDAAHDHCLADCSWLVTTAMPPYTHAPKATEQFAAADDEMFETHGAGTFQAFRSLPVTRRNTDVGTLVLAAQDEPPRWFTLGEVEEIDWDAGQLRLKGVLHEVYDLAWSRVVVLRYVNGGRVEVMNGLTRDRLAIRPDELVVPSTPPRPD